MTRYLLRVTMMPELVDIVTLILKHLPPSASLPNVRACDERGRRWSMALERQGYITLADQRPFDGVIASDIAFAAEAAALLRPNGRAIFLIPNTEDVTGEALADALASAGFVRALTETVLDNAYVLARGERPTEQIRTTDRIAAIAQVSTGAVTVIELEEAERQYWSLHLLVRQHPPSRSWDDRQPNTSWQAITVRDDKTDRVVLLAFTSLVKAVTFLQPAVLARAIQNVNKLPRYEMKHFRQWNVPLIVNPVFEALREDSRFVFDAPLLEVDPLGAMRSNE